MKSTDLRRLSRDELSARAGELAAQISSLRIVLRLGKEKNVKKLRTLRHDRARVLTVLREHVRLGGGAGRFRATQKRLP